MSNLPHHGSLKVLPASTAHTFIVPIRKINEGHDVSHFLISKAYTDLMTFLLHLNRAMFPRAFVNAQTSTFSSSVQKLQGLMKALESILDMVPADTGPRRFGNVSFRTWCQKVEEKAPALIEEYLPSLKRTSTADVTPQAELLPYLMGSFGSAQRLDYGSGHELSFFAFLGCIWKLGGFPCDEKCSADEQARGIVLGIFTEYLHLIRRLIKTYTLEPAGSHGVWGLDDHSFIPYIFGSAQYGPEIPSEDSPTPMEGSVKSAPEPAEITRVDAVTKYRESNLYFGAIGFIHDVKTGPFWEHSPTLYDISGVKAGWGKINKGMIKMYNAEVLSKFPVVQHFPFGSLFSWEPDPDAQAQPTSIHTMNQPTKDGKGFLPSEATGRALRQGDMMTSMVSHIPPSSLSTGIPAETHLNGAQPSVSAPWATTSFPTNARDPRVTTSDIDSQHPVTDTASRLPPFSGLAQRGPDDNVNSTGSEPVDKNHATSMPPPTRAPWAK